MEGFRENTKVLGNFKLWFVCILLEVLTVNPTYEPLRWFKIAMIQVNMNSCMHVLVESFEKFHEKLVSCM